MKYEKIIIKVENGFFVDLYEVDGPSVKKYGPSVKKCQEFIAMVALTEDFANLLVEDFLQGKLNKEKEVNQMKLNVLSNSPDKSEELFYSLKKLIIFCDRENSRSYQDFPLDQLYPDIFPPIRKLIKSIERNK